MRGNSFTERAYTKSAAREGLDEGRKEIENFLTWCQDTNFTLNVTKMKELVINFREEFVYMLQSTSTELTWTWTWSRASGSQA